MPELWQRLHPGFRLLPQLPDSLTGHGKAARACPDRRARRTCGVRRGRLRRFDDRTRRASAGESDQPRRFSRRGEFVADGGAERAAHGGGKPLRIRDDTVTVVYYNH